MIWFCLILSHSAAVALGMLILMSAKRSPIAGGSRRKARVES